MLLLSIANLYICISKGISSFEIICQRDCCLGSTCCEYHVMFFQFVKMLLGMVLGIVLQSDGVRISDAFKLFAIFMIFEQIDEFIDVIGNH